MGLLFSGGIDVLVLDNSVRDYLIEIDPKFEAKTKIIWTVEKTSIKEVIVKEVDISKKPFIVMISGIDIAGPISLRSRSDVNIIMVVNPTTNKILTVSIPRDTYVPLGCETGAFDKLTHSGMFGVNCTVKTIENLVGINVNYYLRVNFSSLTKIIDVVGNIDVYSKYTFTTEDGSYYKSGMNSLNSAKALTFARARHQFESGDIQRGLNQQEVIKGLINKLTSPATLTKINGIITATSKSIDTNMTTDDISKLVKKQIENNQPWEITTSNLSGVGDMQPTYSMGDRLLYVMQPDAASLAQIKKSIEEFMVVVK
jgi:LCP family protein required for cell wall assembly